MCELKLAVSTFYIYKEKLLNNFSKILEKYFELVTGRQFDICYVIKTGVGFKIAEITRFLNYFSSYSFAL